MFLWELSWEKTVRKMVRDIQVGGSEEFCGLDVVLIGCDYRPVADVINGTGSGASTASISNYSYMSLYSGV
jgi:hypothetical protein